MSAPELAAFAIVVFLSGIFIGSSWSAALLRRRTPQVEAEFSEEPGSWEEAQDVVREALLANARTALYARRNPPAEVAEEEETVAGVR